MKAVRSQYGAPTRIGRRSRNVCLRPIFNRNVSFSTDFVGVRLYICNVPLVATDRNLRYSRIAANRERLRVDAFISTIISSSFSAPKHQALKSWGLISIINLYAMLSISLLWFDVHRMITSYRVRQWLRDWADFERSKYDSSTEEDSPIHGLIIGVLFLFSQRRCIIVRTSVEVLKCLVRIIFFIRTGRSFLTGLINSILPLPSPLKDPSHELI